MLVPTSHVLNLAASDDCLPGSPCCVLVCGAYVAVRRVLPREHLVLNVVGPCYNAVFA